MTETCSELVWLTRLIADLEVPFQDPIPVYRNNQSMLHISQNPVFHERTKHIELDCHLVRQHLIHCLITPKYIASTVQPVDLLTKSFPSDALSKLSSKLNCLNLLHRLSLTVAVEDPCPSSIQDQPSIAS